MIPRLLSACGVAVILMLAALLLPTLTVADQAPSQGPQTVWRGEVRDVKAYGTVDSSGNPATYQHHIAVDFRYVQETDRNGTRFTSRRVSWQADGRSQSAAQLHECRGSGSIELGPSSSVDAVTDEQARALRIPCTSRDFMSHFTFIEQPPQRIAVPRIVDWEKLREGCSYSEERGSERYTVSVAPEIDGVIELDTRSGGDYAGLVPSPGRTLVLTVTTRPAIPSYFKFVLEPNEVSRFPGYASNAYVDEAFFVKAGLTDLQNRYPDDGPDLLFAPRDYEDRRLWRTVDFATAETGRPETDATVTITAMDYGAIGRLRAFVKGAACGGWQPVRVRVNEQDRDYVTIPMDEDKNLIADALESYRGDPGRDDEDTPKGDGTRGDGLTAFEEYRGFMISGSDCEDQSTDVHLRTVPYHKDVFLAGDPIFTGGGNSLFASVSDLSVHSLCTRHLWDLPKLDDALAEYSLANEHIDVEPETRVVNFTMARLPQGRFDNHVVHLGPQHGIYVRYDHLLPRIGGLLGLAIPTEQGRMGSPRYTALVVISSSFMLEDFDSHEAVLRLRHTVVHELGHAVGIPHHSDSREGTRVVLGKLDVTHRLSPWQAAGIPIDAPDAALFGLENHAIDALLIEPGTGCKAGDPGTAYRQGVFAGCLASFIVRRGQQESGDVWCPMRYWVADFYEPPGVKALYSWTDEVTDVPAPLEAAAPRAARGRGPGPTRAIDPRVLPRVQTHSWVVDAWRADVDSLLRYSEPTPSGAERFGKFCANYGGTEENARRDYRNLAGDAGRPHACTQFIVVNDNGRP